MRKLFFKYGQICAMSTMRAKTKLIGPSSASAGILRSLVVKNDRDSVRSTVKEMLLRESIVPLGDKSIVPKASKNSVANFISSIAVDRKKADVALAEGIIRCLGEDAGAAASRTSSYLRLLDVCIEYGHTKEALRVYTAAWCSGVLFDRGAYQRLLEHLRAKGRVDDMIRVVSNMPTMSSFALKLIAEPTIMSGLTLQFAMLFKKYLEHQSIDNSADVAGVIRSIVFAKVRRHVGGPTFQSENERIGSGGIRMAIDNYHNAIRLSEKFNASVTYGDKEKSLRRLPSYVAYEQLEDVDNFEPAGVDTDVAESSAAGQLSSAVDFRKTLANGLLPMQMSGSHMMFPYVMESEPADDEPQPLDLSAELQMCQHDRNILYSARIWPDSFSLEQKGYVQEAVKSIHSTSSIFPGMVTLNVSTVPDSMASSRGGNSNVFPADLDEDGFDIQSAIENGELDEFDLMGEDGMTEDDDDDDDDDDDSDDDSQTTNLGDMSELMDADDADLSDADDFLGEHFQAAMYSMGENDNLVPSIPDLTSEVAALNKRRRSRVIQRRRFLQLKDKEDR